MRWPASRLAPSRFSSNTARKWRPCGATPATSPNALDAADRERERLRQRVEALEAIVTTDTYDALRADPADARARLDAGLLDPLPTPEVDESQAPQRARSRGR